MPEEKNGHNYVKDLLKIKRKIKNFAFVHDKGLHVVQSTHPHKNTGLTKHSVEPPVTNKHLTVKLLNYNKLL